MKFDDNFTWVSWLLDFITSTVIEDESRRRYQIISVKETASLVTIPSEVKTVQMRGKNVSSTAITATSTTTVVNTNVSSISKFETIYCLTKIHHSKKPVWQWAEGKKTKAEKLEDFTTDQNQDNNIENKMATG